MKKTKFRLIKILSLVVATLVLNGCIHVEIKGAGVFKEPVKYDNRYTAYINIPVGVYGKDAKHLSKEEADGSKIGFVYLGGCGGGISFTGIMIPVVPWFFLNKCEEGGFAYISKHYIDTLGVTLQLHYNNQTHDPYIDHGSVKFKIENFSEFKRAPDKTLIIHKKKPDGTIFTKELPFDWKVVVETTGGL